MTSVGVMVAMFLSFFCMEDGMARMDSSNGWGGR